MSVCMCIQSFSKEIVRCVFLYFVSRQDYLYGGFLENFIILVQLLIKFEYAGNIAATIDIIRGRPYGHQTSIKNLFVALHY